MRVTLVLALLVAACGSSPSRPAAPASGASSPPDTAASSGASGPSSPASPPASPPSADEMVCTGAGPKVARVCSVHAITPSVRAALDADPDRGHLLVAFTPETTQAGFDTVASLSWLSHVSIKGAKAVTTLSALSELKSLRKLNLSDSGVKSLGPLRALVDIDKLEASGCPLEDNELSALAGMRRLKYLDLARSGSKVTDVSALADLPELDLVNLTGAPATSVDFAAKLPKLTRLFAPAGTSDIAPLTSAPELRVLSIEAAKPRNLPAIAKLTKLATLRLVDVELKDASPLAALTDLETLSIAKNPVKDAAPIAKLGKLRSLDISGTKIASVAPLAKLGALEWLDARGAPVKDWKALKSPSLKSVKIDAGVSKDDVDALKKVLPAARVDVE